MHSIASFARRHRTVLLLSFIAFWCAAAGYFMWRAKTASPTFIEAELVACQRKCSPLRAALETSRPERAFQQNSWRAQP